MFNKRKIDCDPGDLSFKDLFGSKKKFGGCQGSRDISFKAELSVSEVRIDVFIIETGNGRPLCMFLGGSQTKISFEGEALSFFKGDNFNIRFDLNIGTTGDEVRTKDG